MAVFLSRSYFGRDFNLAVVQQRITFQVEAQIPKLSSLNDIIKLKVYWLNSQFWNFVNEASDAILRDEILIHFLSI